MRATLARAVFVLFVACTGNREPADPSAVVVPPQPQPIVTAPASTPPPPSSAAPVATTVPFKCETGKRFDINSRPYCAYESADTWEGSEARCVANGGHLLTLDTAGTSNAIRVSLGSPIGAGRAAWIGLEGTKTGKGTQRDWKWITGEALTTPSWKPNEPNDWDGNEGCAEILTAYGLWNDTRCNLKQGYLCQGKPSTKLTCPGKAFEANGVSYCLNAREKTYAEAKRACAADGGMLAVLKTVEDNNHVKNAMAARVVGHRWWIGLTDAAEEGTWTWSSGAPFSWSNWQEEEPNDFNGENCVELFSDTFTWNDRDCTLALPSICEGPKK